MGAEGFGGYFDALDQGVGSGPEDHLGSVRRAVERLRVPVIASLNGTSPGGWTHYAKALADTGVAAIECNIYLVAADTSVSGTEVEDRYLQVVSAIAGAVDVPVSVKLGPYFSSPGHLARRVVDAGARGLVLFNRFYQPDIDLDTLTVSPNLVLSDPHELRLVLRWMAILRGRVAADLAATTGVHEATDAVKLLLAGADVVMMASALLRHGPEHVATVLAGMAQWFGERDYVSVDQARGSLSQESVPDPEAFERANYMATLRSYGTGTGPLRSGAGT